MTSIPQATNKFKFMAERPDHTHRLFNNINNARAWAGTFGSLWKPLAGGWTRLP